MSFNDGWLSECVLNACNDLPIDIDYYPLCRSNANRVELSWIDLTVCVSVFSEFWTFCSRHPRRLACSYYRAIWFDWCSWSECLAHSLIYNINQTVNDGVAHSKNPKKCAYHVAFDHDLDLEHTLNARWPGVHLVQVWWRSGHLPVRRNDLRKSLGYRQTDGRTDDGRRAIALVHSWNELKISEQFNKFGTTESV